MGLKEWIEPAPREWEKLRLNKEVGGFGMFSSEERKKAIWTIQKTAKALHELLAAIGEDHPAWSRSADAQRYVVMNFGEGERIALWKIRGCPSAAPVSESGEKMRWSKSLHWMLGSRLASGEILEQATALLDRQGLLSASEGEAPAPKSAPKRGL